MDPFGVGSCPGCRAMASTSVRVSTSTSHRGRGLGASVGRAPSVLEGWEWPRVEVEIQSVGA